MAGMAGTQNYNRLDLIFNDHGLATSHSEEREFSTWTDLLVHEGAFEVPDPIPYNSPRVPPQIIKNVLGVREAVTLELVNELHKHDGMRHKTTVGKEITKQLEKEDSEIAREISEKELQKKSLRKSVKSQKRTQDMNALEEKIQELKAKHELLKSSMKWWMKN
jgi:hypothetical protein